MPSDMDARYRSASIDAVAAERECASVMKEPSTTSAPSCKLKVALSILTLHARPGADKKE